MESYVDKDWYRVTCSLCVTYYKNVEANREALKELWLRLEKATPWGVTTSNHTLSFLPNGESHPHVCANIKIKYDDGFMFNTLTVGWVVPYYVRASEITAFRARSLAIADMVFDELERVREVSSDLQFNGTTVRFKKSNTKATSF